MLQSSGVTKMTSATGHWLLQRITAALLIPLSFHLLSFLKLTATASYQETLSWFNSPVNKFYLLAWFLLTFYHAAMGLQVVFEDYVGNREYQARLIKAVNIGFLLLAFVAVILLLTI